MTQSLQPYFGSSVRGKQKKPALLTLSTWTVIGNGYTESGSQVFAGLRTADSKNIRRVGGSIRTDLKGLCKTLNSWTSAKKRRTNS